MRIIKKLALCTAMFSMLICSVVSAESGSALVYTSVQQGFSDKIVVEITNGDFSERTVLQASTFYMATIPSLPTGTLQVNAYISKADSVNDEVYEHPDFFLDYRKSVPLIAADTATIEIKVTPIQKEETESPEATIVPEVEMPSTQPGTIANTTNDVTVSAMIWTIIKRSWFTFILIALGLIIWGAFALRNLIYKE